MCEHEFRLMMSSEPAGMGQRKARRLGKIDGTENDTDGLALPNAHLDSPSHSTRRRQRRELYGSARIKREQCACQVGSGSRLSSSQPGMGLFVRTSLYCTECDIGSQPAFRVHRQSRASRAMRAASGLSAAPKGSSDPSGTASASSSQHDCTAAHRETKSHLEIAFGRRSECRRDARCVLHASAAIHSETHRSPGLLLHPRGPNRIIDVDACRGNPSTG